MLPILIGSGGQLNCFYGLNLFSVRFKFRKFETCANGLSLYISHLGTIKNLLRNFAMQNCSRPAAVKTGFTHFYFPFAASSKPEKLDILPESQHGTQFLQRLPQKIKNKQ